MAALAAASRKLSCDPPAKSKKMHARASCRKAGSTFRKNSMLTVLESISFMRFDGVNQKAS